MLKNPSHVSPTIRSLIPPRPKKGVFKVFESNWWTRYCYILIIVPSAGVWTHPFRSTTSNPWHWRRLHYVACATDYTGGDYHPVSHVYLLDSMHSTQQNNVQYNVQYTPQQPPPNTNHVPRCSHCGITRHLMICTRCDNNKPVCAKSDCRYAEGHSRHPFGLKTMWYPYYMYLIT